MVELDWEFKRSLRIELLEISDKIQDLSLRLRNSGVDREISVDLNNLQVRVGELIGRLWRS